MGNDPLARSIHCSIDQIPTKQKLAVDKEQDQRAGLIGEPELGESHGTHARCADATDLGDEPEAAENWIGFYSGSTRYLWTSVEDMQRQIHTCLESDVSTAKTAASTRQHRETTDAHTPATT